MIATDMIDSDANADNIAHHMISLFLKLFPGRLDVIFTLLCQHGYLRAAQQMYRQHKFYADDGFHHLLEDCCRNGHLAVVQWLRAIKFDFHIFFDQYAFPQICGASDLIIVQWLSIVLEEYECYIKKAFESSCLTGNLPTARWLLQMFPDINVHARNGDVFKICCGTKKWHTAQWLCKIMENNVYGIRYYLIDNIGCIVNRCAQKIWNYVYSCGSQYAHCQKRIPHIFQLLPYVPPKKPLTDSVN